jgi:hypothetical protein
MISSIYIFEMNSLKIIIFMILVLLTGCEIITTPNGVAQEVAESVPPTAANNLTDLIVNLSSDDPMVRIVSAYALGKYGEKAVVAIPVLIENLSYEDFSDVRRSAAEALGKIGPGAFKAVPNLLSILENENEAYQVRDSAIRAVGKIGDRASIPVLVSLLYKDDRVSKRLAPISAMSIAQIVREEFEDSDDYVFRVNEDGIPLIVIDARKWWEENGQFQEWTRMSKEVSRSQTMLSYNGNSTHLFRHDFSSDCVPYRLAFKMPVIRH